MRRYTRRPLPGDPTDPAGLTGLLERYLLWMATHHYAQGTVLVRRVTLGKFLRWCHERSVTQAREVTREMVERYQRHLFYYRKRNGDPLTVTSQAHWLTALRSWFAWMRRERLLDEDPASLMQLPREEHRLPRHALSEREVEAVLAQPQLSRPCGVRDRAILETLYSTGLRREKRWACTWETWTASGARCWCVAARGTRIASCRSDRGRWPGSRSTWPRSGHASWWRPTRPRSS